MHDASVYCIASPAAALICYDSTLSASVR